MTEVLKTRAGDIIGTRLEERDDGPPQSHADDPYLTAKQVRLRYGGISDMSLWRWLADPDLEFPQPERIRKRRYWRASRLDAWDAKRRVQST